MFSFRNMCYVVYVVSLASKSFLRQYSPSKSFRSFELSEVLYKVHAKCRVAAQAQIHVGGRPSADDHCPASPGSATIVALSLIVRFVLAKAASVAWTMDGIVHNVVENSDTFFNSSLFFNTSLKLAHRFLSLPSRALARLRRLDDMALDLHEAAAATHASKAGNYYPNDGTGAHQGYRRHRHLGSAANSPPMPGPWGFLTSGYFVGLFLMVSGFSTASLNFHSSANTEPPPTP